MSGEFIVLFLNRLPNRETIPIAVILYLKGTDELHHRFREDLAEIADDDEAEVLSLWPGMVTSRAQEEGAGALYRQLVDTLSNSITISDPQEVRDGAVDPRHTIDDLFEQHVERFIGSQSRLSHQS